MDKELSEGRVDCIVETPQYVYIFEFKLDGTAAEALQQIEEKGYAREYKADARQVVKVGVSFSSQTGTIEEWEVRKWYLIICFFFTDVFVLIPVKETSTLKMKHRSFYITFIANLVSTILLLGACSNHPDTSDYLRLE